MNTNDTVILQDLLSLLKEKFFDDSFYYNIALFFKRLFHSKEAFVIIIDYVNNEALFSSSEKDKELISLEELSKKLEIGDLAHFTTSSEPGYVRGDKQVLIRLGKFDKDYFVFLRELEDNSTIEENFILLLLQMVNFSISLRVKIFEEQKALERGTEEQIRIKNYFKALFHDLKTPLSTIAIALDVLKEKVQGDRDALNVIKQAKEANKEFADTIEKFLDLEKSRQNLQINVKKEDINKVIKNVLNRVIPVYKDKNIQVNVINLEKPCFAEFDPFWMEKALKNVIENAFKYNVENGSITVETIPSTDRVTIKVKDTGIGIHEEELQNIFKEFYRGKNASHSGSGLGLAVTKSIIQAHGGHIEVKSKKNNGATFIITIPKTSYYKQSRKRIKKFLLFALPIIVVLGSIVYFPLIPVKLSTQKSEMATVLTVQDGTTVRLFNDASFSVKRCNRNLLGNRNIISINLMKGNASINSTKTRVYLKTKNGTVRDYGTEFDVKATDKFSNTSVLNGKVSLKHLYAEKGNGIFATENGVKVVKLLHPVYNFSYKNTENGALQFSWDAIHNAKYYQIIIAKDKALKNILKVVTTPNNYAQFNIAKDGYYYVRIQAVDSYDLTGMPLDIKVNNEYHLKKGIEERDKGNIANAISELKTSLADYGFNNPDVLSELAWTYYAKGNYEKAVSIYNELVKIRKMPKDQVRLALSYTHLRDYNEAETLFISLLNKYPNDADALWGYANLEFARGNIDKAEMLCKKTLSLSKKYPLANYLMAEIYLKKGNTTKAKESLEKEVKYHPDCKEAQELLKRINQG